ncbi:MAG: toll/interleukin-1 receptor domain-containing protein [Almyronema sp.]
MTRQALILNLADYSDRQLPALDPAPGWALSQQLEAAGHFSPLTRLPLSGEALSSKAIGQALRHFLLAPASPTAGLIYLNSYSLMLEDSLGELQGVLLPADAAIVGDGSSIVEQRNGLLLESLNGLMRKSTLSQLTVLWDSYHHGLGLTPAVLEATLTVFTEKPNYCLITTAIAPASDQSAQTTLTQTLLDLLVPAQADAAGQISSDRLFAALKRQPQTLAGLPVQLGHSDWAIVSYGANLPAAPPPPVSPIFHISHSNLTNLATSGDIHYTEAANQIRQINANSSPLNLHRGTVPPVEANPLPPPAPVATPRDRQPPPALKPVEVFFSYSHRDEDLRDEMAKHLSILQRQGIIAAWYDRDIEVGAEWAADIDAHLNSAQVILLLISPDFIASDYCFDLEMKRAMDRHAAGEAYVVPVILRPVDWSGAAFSKLQALPKNAKPVTTWANRDQAFENVARGIRQLVERLSRLSDAGLSE